LLIEDVPGVGKTTLAQTLARSFDCIPAYSVHRICFLRHRRVEVFNQRSEYVRV
jgi:MoxR-like ATPase